MRGIFVLSFRRIDRAFESCGSFSVIVVATRDRYNDQKKKKNGFTGKRYRVSRSIVRSKETKVKICEDEPLNEIADYVPRNGSKTTTTISSKFSKEFPYERF